MGVYSKKTAPEAVVTESIDPIQFVIESHQQEHALFEAIIETDFAQAYNDCGLISLTESDISSIHESADKSLKEKIKELIDKFWTMISNFFKELMSKIKTLLMNDKKLVEAYDKYMNLEQLQKDKCPVKGTVVVDTEYAKWRKDVQDINSNIASMTMDNLDKVEEYTTTMDNLLNEEKIKALFKNSTEKEAIFEIGTSGFAFMCNDIKAGYKSAVEILQLGEKSAKGTVDNLRKTIKDQVKASEDKATTESLNEQYKKVSKFLNAVSRFQKSISGVAKKIISTERVMYVKIGTWAAKKYGKSEDSASKASEPIEKVTGDVVDANGEKVGESTELFEAYSTLIEMENEEYMDSVFA